MLLGKSKIIVDNWYYIYYTKKANFINFAIYNLDYAKFDLLLTNQII